MEQQHIDSLLERYLSLVDEYSRLREELTKLQTGVYQNIARANFAGERGMRYGQDHYDERMRALRVLDIKFGEEDVPNFTIKTLISPTGDATGEDEDRKEDEKRDGSLEEETADIGTNQENPVDSSKEKSGSEEQQNNEERKKMKKPNSNPLRWFGLFAPPPLRTAQTLSIQAVEEAIPRLVSVNAEMEHVEIEIRRARKKRAKATAALATEREASKLETVEAR
jgi:hypothetical protein